MELVYGANYTELELQRMAIDIFHVEAHKLMFMASLGSMCVLECVNKAFYRSLNVAGVTIEQKATEEDKQLLEQNETSSPPIKDVGLIRKEEEEDCDKAFPVVKAIEEPENVQTEEDISMMILSAARGPTINNNTNSNVKTDTPKKKGADEDEAGEEYGEGDEGENSEGNEDQEGNEEDEEGDGEGDAEEEEVDEEEEPEQEEGEEEEENEEQQQHNIAVPNNVGEEDDEDDSDGGGVDDEEDEEEDEEGGVAPPKKKMKK